MAVGAANHYTISAGYGGSREAFLKARFFGRLEADLLGGFEDGKLEGGLSEWGKHLVTRRDLSKTVFGLEIGRRTAEIWRG